MVANLRIFLKWKIMLKGYIQKCRRLNILLKKNIYFGGNYYFNNYS